MSTAATDHLGRAEQLLSRAAAHLRKITGRPTATRRRGPRIVSQADADALGVDRTHLWRVLKGKRPSKSLLARYRALKRQQKQNGEAA